MIEVARRRVFNTRTTVSNKILHSATDRDENHLKCHLIKPINDYTILR